MHCDYAAYSFVYLFRIWLDNTFMAGVAQAIID